MSAARAQSFGPRGLFDPLVKACKETAGGNKCEKPHELIEVARRACLESLKQNHCAEYAQRVGSKPGVSEKLATCSPQEICEGIDPTSSASFASIGVGEAFVENILDYVEMVVSPFTKSVSQFGCNDDSIVSKTMALEGLPLPSGRDLKSMDCREISRYVSLKQPEFIAGIQKKGGLSTFEKDPSRFSETERAHLMAAIKARSDAKGAFDRTVNAVMDKMNLVGGCYKPSELAVLKGYIVGSIMSPPGPGKATQLKKVAEMAGIAAEEKALKEAAGLATEAKVVSEMSSEASVLKHAGKVESEIKMSPEQMRVFDKLNEEGFPKVGSRTSGVLALVDGNRKVEVEVRGMAGSKTQWMTRDEALKAIENDAVDSLNILRVEPAKGQIDVSKVAPKISGEIQGQADDIHTSLVTYQNGTVARVYGTRDMIQNIAAQENVRRIDVGTEGPSWVQGVHRVPEEQKAASYNPSDVYRKRLGASVTSNSKDSDISGLTVHHGTVKENEASVLAGPKNYGTGFGGSGLYLAVKGGRDLAEEYAAHAAKAPENRVSYSRGAGDTKPIDARPVVLDGKVNPNKNYRVGTFQITRDGIPDLTRGILPYNWADDPSLVQFLNQEFDILDLRGMRSNGLNMNSDRFLVIKERAGSDAVIWNRSSK